MGAVEKIVENLLISVVEKPVENVVNFLTMCADKENSGRNLPATIVDYGSISMLAIPSKGKTRSDIPFDMTIVNSSDD